MQLSIGMFRLRLFVQISWFIFLDVLNRLKYHRAFLLSGSALLLLVALNTANLQNLSILFVSPPPQPVPTNSEHNTLATDWELLQEYESLSGLHSQSPDHLQVLINLIAISHTLGYSDAETQYRSELHQVYPTYPLRTH